MPLPELSDEQRAWYILQGYEIEEYRGPVFETTRRFLFDGKLHREDGPAYESISHSSWYIHGVHQHYIDRRRWRSRPTIR